jgi:general secretion pathway protein C
MNTEIKLLLSRPLVPQLMSFVLAFLLLWQLASGIYAWINLHGELALSKQDTFIVTSPKRKPVRILPLFGLYVPLSANDADVKESSLNLTVVGVVLSSSGQDSHVILQLDNGEQKIYQVGDVVPGGARVMRITEEGVLLNRKGDVESLILPKNELLFEALPKPFED